MKASNRILLIFFSGALLYMLAAFAEVRLSGERSDLHSNAEVETVRLENMKYLVLSDLERRVNITSSDEPRIELRSNTGQLLSNLSYNLSGDTLRLLTLNLEEDIRVELTIYVPNEGFLGLESRGINVDIFRIEQLTLSLNLQGGRVTMDDNIELDKLSITASKNAQFDLFDGDVDTLMLDLDEANVEIRIGINRLEGQMNNGAVLSLFGANEFAFTKDKLSTMRVETIAL